MTKRGGYLTRGELLRLRGSLDYARDDGTFYSVIQSEAKNLLERLFSLAVISTKRSALRNPLRRSSTLLRVDTRVDINPSRDFRYTQKRSICAIALDMP